MSSIFLNKGLRPSPLKFSDHPHLHKEPLGVEEIGYGKTKDSGRGGRQTKKGERGSIETTGTPWRCRSKHRLMTHTPSN